MKDHSAPLERWCNMMSTVFSNLCFSVTSLRCVRVIRVSIHDVIRLHRYLGAGILRSTRRSMSFVGVGDALKPGILPSPRNKCSAHSLLLFAEPLAEALSRDVRIIKSLKGGGGDRGEMSQQFDFPGIPARSLRRGFCTTPRVSFGGDVAASNHFRGLLGLQ